jgi:hypothetical protein
MRLWGNVAALAFVSAMRAQSASAATIDVDNLLEGPPVGSNTSGLAAASHISAE